MPKTRFQRLVICFCIGALPLILISVAFAQDGDDSNTSWTIQSDATINTMLNFQAIGQNAGPNDGNGGNATTTLTVNGTMNQYFSGRATGGDGSGTGDGGNAVSQQIITGTMNNTIESFATGGTGANGGDATVNITIGNTATVNGDVGAEIEGGEGDAGNGGDAILNMNINANAVGDITINAEGGCSTAAGGQGGNVDVSNSTINVAQSDDIYIYATGGCGDIGGDVSDLALDFADGTHGAMTIGIIGGCGESQGGNTGDLTVNVDGTTTASSLDLGNIGGASCDPNGQGGNSGDINLTLNGTVNVNTIFVANDAGCGDAGNGQSGDVNVNIAGNVTTDALLIGKGPCGDTGDVNMNVAGTMDGSMVILSMADCVNNTPLINVDVSGEMATSGGSFAFLSVIECGNYAVDISGNITGDVGFANNFGDTHIAITGTVTGGLAALNADVTGTVQVVLSGDAAIGGGINGSAGADFGAGNRGARSELVFNFITHDRGEYESFMAQLAVANPMGGSITFQGRVYAWTSFDQLINQLRLIEQASQAAYGFSADGFCVQAGTYIALNDGTINVYDNLANLLISYDTSETDSLIPSDNKALDHSESGYVSLYRLTSGEYQVNVGPDGEGKLHSCIWTGVIDPENVRQFAAEA